VSKVDLRLQCGMPCSKLEVATVQHGTLSGAGYLHQSHLFLVEGEQGKPLKLDGCLLSLRETHFASPPDFEFCFVRDPGLWRRLLRSE
jgi:hypothetical protein